MANQSSYFYIGHFARFVQPGARRVLYAATREDLEATAFVNPEGSIATVVMNRTHESIDFALHHAGARFVTALPPRAIANYVAAGTA